MRVGEATYTLGVLVQSNFGGALEIRGVQVGRLLWGAGFLDRWTPPAGDAEAFADKRARARVCADGTPVAPEVTPCIPRPASSPRS